MDEIIKLFGVAYGEHFLLNDRGGEFFFTPSALKRVFNGVTTDDPRTLMDMLAKRCTLDDVYDNVGYGDDFWHIEHINGKDYVRKDVFDIYDPVCLSLYKSNNVFKTQKAASRNIERVKKELNDFYNDSVRGYGDE